MIVNGTCLSYLLECMDGIHQPDDAYMIALYSSSADIGPNTTRYTTAAEIQAPTYRAGGALLSGRVTGIRDGRVYLNFADQEWPLDAGKMAARGCLVYNRSKDNRAVCVGDFGDDIVSTNAPFTAHFPPQGCVVISSITASNGSS